MDKQKRLRQAEQNNIAKAIAAHHERLQQAFTNAQNPKPIDWFRSSHSWAVPGNRGNLQHPSNNPKLAG